MKKIILSAIMLTGMLTFAQDGKLTISGTVDAYATVNSIDGAGAPGLLVDAPQNAILGGLGMANTIFSYENGKSGAVVDLAFGPRAADAVGFGGIVNQMYAYYNINDKLTVTAGQFNTFLGYEVISPAANFNYTVSYLFNAGPFTHIGAKIDYAATDDLSFMLALTNPHGQFAGIDLDEDGENEVEAGYGVEKLPQLGLQVGYKGQYLNLVYGTDGFGADDQLYIDYTGGFDITESTYLGLNAAYSSSSDVESGYQGFALYLQQAINDSFSLGLRPELFQLNGDANNDESVTAITLTGNVTLTENLSIIADLRYDSSEDNIIEYTTGSVFPNEDSVTQLTIAAVYSF